MKVQKADLTEELLKLLIITSQIARAIRLNSAYASNSKDDPNTSVNVMELSECLHNFDQLSKVIADDDIKGINHIWDYLIEEFVRCQKIQAFQQFVRENTLIMAIGVFRNIRTKVNMVS